MSYHCPGRWHFVGRAACTFPKAMLQFSAIPRNDTSLPPRSALPRIRITNSFLKKFFWNLIRALTKWNSESPGGRDHKFLLYSCILPLQSAYGHLLETRQLYSADFLPGPMRPVIVGKRRNQIMSCLYKIMWKLFQCNTRCRRRPLFWATADEFLKRSSALFLSAFVKVLIKGRKNPESSLWRSQFP